MQNRPLAQWKFLQLKKFLKKASPKPCFLHTCTQIGSKMLVYGGCDLHGGALNQVFLFDAQTYQWSSPGDGSGFSDDHAGARYGHTATLVDMHPPRVMIYGGMVASKTYEFDAPDSADSPETGISMLSELSFLSSRRKGKNIAAGSEEPDDSVSGNNCVYLP
jgi:hypothetical protein